MSLPKDLLYSEEHIWVKKEKGQVRIGITEFAQAELGDIVFVELPEVGDEIELGEPLGSVESVKTVSELYAPLSGVVVEINEELEDSPEFINKSPYENAWMVVVKPSDESEMEMNELLIDEEYKSFLVVRKV